MARNIKAKPIMRRRAARPLHLSLPIGKRRAFRLWLTSRAYRRET